MQSGEVKCAIDSCSHVLLAVWQHGLSKLAMLLIICGRPVPVHCPAMRSSHHAVVVLVFMIDHVLPHSSGSTCLHNVLR